MHTKCKTVIYGYTFDASQDSRRLAASGVEFRAILGFRRVYIGGNGS